MEHLNEYNLWNGTNIFSMMWNQSLWLLINTHFSGLQAKFSSMISVLTWDCDLDDAFDDVTRVQRAGNLDAHRLLALTNSTSGVTSEDILEMVEMSDAADDPARTLQWVDVGLELCRAGGTTWAVFKGIQARTLARVCHRTHLHLKQDPSGRMTW